MDLYATRWIRGPRAKRAKSLAARCGATLALSFVVPKSTAPQKGSSFPPEEVRSGEFRVLPDGKLIALAAEGRDAPPSSRPSRIPTIPTVNEARPIPSMQHGPPMPLDMIVPMATSKSRSGLDHRSAFLLLHVDGRSTLALIAAAVDLPRIDVYDCFLNLRDHGYVELAAIHDLPLSR